MFKLSAQVLFLISMSLFSCNDLEEHDYTVIYETLVFDQDYKEVILVDTFNCTCSLINSKREGVAQCLRDGILRMKYKFKNDQVTGLATIYHEGGKLRETTRYKKDQKSGLSQIYYDSGDLNIIRFYERNKVAYEKVMDKKGDTVITGAEIRVDHKIKRTVDDLSFVELKIELPYSTMKPINLVLAIDSNNDQLADSVLYSKSRFFEYEFTINGSGKQMVTGIIQEFDENLNVSVGEFQFEYNYVID